METKKKKNFLFKILAILFLIFVALILAYESGYYETKNKNRAILTKEAMAKFEEDLSKGEVVDLKDYLEDEKIDYSNKITNNISKFITKGLSGLFKSLKGLFW